MATLFWIVFILGLGGAGCSKLKTELRHIQTKVDLIMVDIVSFRRDLRDLTNSLNNTDNRIEELAGAMGNCDAISEVGDPPEDEAENVSHDTNIMGDLDSQENVSANKGYVKQSKMFQTLERKLDFVMNGVKNEKYSTKYLIEQVQESLQALTNRVVALEEHSNTLSEAFMKIQDIDSKDIEAMNGTIQELVRKFESLQIKCDEKHISITETINDFKQETKNEVEVLQQQIEANTNEIHELNATLHGQLEDVGEEIIDQVQKRLEKDCQAIQNNDANARSGVYDATLEDGSTLTVFCDMETDGGGWTVFQNRFDGSVDFYQEFEEYDKGFGDINGEFWLGLTHVHAMTRTVRSVLRIDLEDASGKTADVTFGNFYLSAGPQYKLNIDRGVGTAGDRQGLSYNDEQPFSTKDRDQGGRGCPAKDQGGWWYKNCAYANLNGKYETPGTKSRFNNGEGGMTYRQFSGGTSLKKSKMMFRPV